MDSLGRPGMDRAWHRPRHAPRPIPFTDSNRSMTSNPVSPFRRWLGFRTYVVASTTIIGALALAAFTRASQKPHFQEIDLERINVVEPDGKLRLTISDAARSPGWVFHGKTYPGRPKSAGMIFFNDEGEEDGGIGYGGHSTNGKVEADGGMAFDQYNQDESVSIKYSENNGKRMSGLAVNDHANVPISAMLERRDALLKIPAGPRRDSAMRAFADNNGDPIWAQRVFAGRDRSRNAVVNLADPQGRPRLRLVVDSTGTASIQFLDTAGHVTRTISAQNAGDSK